MMNTMLSNFNNCMQHCELNIRIVDTVINISDFVITIESSSTSYMFVYILWSPHHMDSSCCNQSLSQHVFDCSFCKYYGVLINHIIWLYHCVVLIHMIVVYVSMLVLSHPDDIHCCKHYVVIIHHTVCV